MTISANIKQYLTLSFRVLAFRHIMRAWNSSSCGGLPNSTFQMNCNKCSISWSHSHWPSIRSDQKNKNSFIFWLFSFLCLSVQLVLLFLIHWGIKESKNQKNQKNQRIHLFFRWKEILTPDLYISNLERFHNKTCCPCTFCTEMKINPIYFK